MASTPRTGVAKALRRNQTRAEGLLWQELRGKRLGGWKWKRQVPVGRYVVDFICHEAGLIVEVDGWTHNEPHEVRYDEARTAYLEAMGHRVLRVTNRGIYESLDGICYSIVVACEERLPLS